MRQGDLKTVLDNLSSDEVSRTLRALGRHREMLESSHQDAKRLADLNLSPAYVVDYQLLRRYMLPEDGPLEWVAELDFLFDETDLRFYLGHGTMLELLHGLKRFTGVDLTVARKELKYASYGREIERAISRLGNLPQSPHAAVARLLSLIEKKNVDQVSRLASDIDSSRAADAFGAAYDVLSRIRRGKHQYYPNIADALNFADVVLLREVGPDISFPYFPFYLTATGPLLNEREWAHDPDAERWGFEAAISRSPLTAIYSSIVASLEPLPDAAVEHTLDLIVQAGMLEFSLRRSAGYRSPTVPAASEEKWKNLLADDRLRHQMSEKLESFSRFVSDPVISTAQTIYDNASRRDGSAEGERVDTAGASIPDEPARRVFDLVLAVARALDESPDSFKAFSDLWRTAIAVERSQEGSGYATLRYLDRTQTAQPYLEAENHSEKFWIFRWPTSCDPDQLVRAFSDAYIGIGRSELILCVGSEGEGVVEFDVVLPTSFKEIADEVEGPIYWMRFGSPELDLYADVVTARERAAVVGAFSPIPNPQALARLYDATSSRFLFQSWLESIFLDATQEAQDAVQAD